jgi:antitoxin MazE
MKIPVIKIGNSKGIRLSKTVLEKYEIRDTLDMVLEDDVIILKPQVKPREGWDEAFSGMHERGDDDLLIDDVLPDETFEEWK